MATIVNIAGAEVKPSTTTPLVTNRNNTNKNRCVCVLTAEQYKRITIFFGVISALSIGFAAGFNDYPSAYKAFGIIGLVNVGFTIISGIAFCCTGSR